MAPCVRIYIPPGRSAAYTFNFLRLLAHSEMVQVQVTSTSSREAQAQARERLLGVAGRLRTLDVPELGELIQCLESPPSGQARLERNAGREE